LERGGCFRYGVWYVTPTPQEMPRREIPPEEIEQHAEMKACQQRVNAWPVTDWRAVRLLSARVRRPAHEADQLEAGDSIRISFLDYKQRKYVIGFARVQQVEHDPGCPWNAFVLPTSWLLIECPDGEIRVARPRPDRVLEIAGNGEAEPR